ncbi:MAG: FeoB-associated Cys-rich membrane protein [Clostridia bacterium]|nr:FeoB-associated Cys-rich membrane protein [Clostridia bacterium]
MSLADIIILTLAVAAVVLLIVVKVRNFTKKDGGCCGCDGCQNRNCAQCAVKETKADGTDPKHDSFG